MRAILYHRETGTVIGGCTGSIEEDIAALTNEAIGYVISDAEWRDSAVDVSDPQNPLVIQKNSSGDL